MEAIFAGSVGAIFDFPRLEHELGAYAAKIIVKHVHTNTIISDEYFLSLFSDSDDFNLKCTFKLSIHYNNEGKSVFTVLFVMIRLHCKSQLISPSSLLSNAI